LRISNFTSVSVVLDGHGKWPKSVREEATLEQSGPTLLVPRTENNFTVDFKGQETRLVTISEK
jgi:hypothetical protein